MATEYEKTENYQLNLYGDDDPADLRDGHNANMRIIDEKLGENLNKVEAIESRETHDEEVIKAVLGDNTVDAATAAKTKWDGYEQTITDNKTNADGLFTALGANTVEKASNILARVHERRRIVTFGDSWLKVNDEALAKAIGSEKNYAVSGVGVNQLAAQVQAASSDSTLTKEYITDVVIIAGTNNVYSGVDATSQDISASLQSVRDTFPDSRILFLPNTSRTSNWSRRYLYKAMLDVADSLGIDTSTDLLWMPFDGNFYMYQGTDVTGVNHLTEEGSQRIGKDILAVVNGGNHSTSTAKFSIHPTYSDGNTQTTDSNPVLDFVITGGITCDITVGGLSGIKWKTNATSDNKKKPIFNIEVSLDSTGAESCPVNWAQAMMPCAIGGTDFGLFIWENKYSNDSKKALLDFRVEYRSDSSWGDLQQIYCTATIGDPLHLYN